MCIPTATVSAMRRAATVLANDALLLLTALIWGLAFVAQRIGMDHVGPFTYNAVRFAIGAVFLLPFALTRGPWSAKPAGDDDKHRSIHDNRPAIGALRAGLLAGAVLVCGASLQQIGLVSTTAGKAGFITGLYVVLVPLSGLLWRQRTGWSSWSGAALCVVGLFFLSVTASFTVERGDLFVLAGAFFLTAHIQVVGWLSPRTDPVRLACVQFTVCSLASAGGALLFEQVGVAPILAAAGPILYGGLLSVGIAFTLQLVAQRSAPPAHAAILLSLESVFAAIGGSLLLGERLGVRGTLGCALMFAGMIISQAPAIAVSLAGSPRRQ
jgi:drug/metabolite transporter (DMT)-like permease